MHSMPYGFLIAMCLMISGCQSPIFQRKYQEVRAEEFIRCYDEKPNRGHQFKYIGIKNGYHVIDYYDLGTTTFMMDYRYSIRTKKDNLPSHFPDHPQARQVPVWVSSINDDAKNGRQTEKILPPRRQEAPRAAKKNLAEGCGWTIRGYTPKP